MKKYATLLLAGLISASAAQADVGNVGGNGGGNEVEFVSIRSEITSWIEARFADGTLEQKLALKNISPSAFRDAYRQAMDTPVLFQEAPVTLAGFSSIPAGRICANGLSPRQIVCQNANWKLASEPIKYAIVLHETLGIAGLEKNQGQYSQYPISHNILPYVERATHVELGSTPNFATELRERFAAAANPSREQLVGKWLHCDNYSAMLPAQRAVPYRPEDLNFQMLETGQAYQLMVHFERPNRLDGMELEDGYSKEWYGRKDTEMQSMEVYLAFRWEAPTGKILEEFSGTNAELQYGIPYLTPLSVVHEFGPNGKVWEYGECTLEARP